MKIDINRIAAFLAGNFPPYYEQYPKIKFMRVLLREVPGIFPEKEEFDFIDKHSTSLQVFFRECFALVEDEQRLKSIIAELRVPFEAQEKYSEPQSGKKEILEEDKKTIGFITPFDEKKDKLQPLIQKILDSRYSGWKLETVSLGKEGDGTYLWSSINDFLEKYPVYIVDFRDSNLNVAIELGGILKTNKPCITITEDKVPTNISGFIRIPKPKVSMEDNDTKTAQGEFEKLLDPHLKRYLK